MSYETKNNLAQIKTLSMLKMEKNFIAVIEKQYSRQPYRYYPLSFFRDRIKQELEEFSRALENNDLSNMKEELADISNLVDYCFELLTRFEYGRQ